MTDLAEGQFQFSTKSHQKEGIFQVFCIQVTPEAFCSHSFSFSSRYIQGHRILDGNQHCIRCYSSAFEHQSQATTASSRDYHHVCRSSLRSVPADEVDDFHISGCMSDPTPSPRQSFCNYLNSEIEHLEERDFLTFRNDTVKLLSEMQYKAEERKRQVTTSQEVTTYQHPEASQSTGWEYVLTIPETQQVSIPVVQPQQTTIGQPVTVIAKVQQPSGPPSLSAQPTSYVVVDDQQPGTSRQMIFNPPSVAPSQQEESQHNTSGISSLIAAIPSVLMYQQMETPQPFSPSQIQPAPSPVPSSTHQERGHGGRVVTLSPPTSAAGV